MQTTLTTVTGQSFKRGAVIDLTYPDGSVRPHKVLRHGMPWSVTVRELRWYELAWRWLRRQLAAGLHRISKCK